ncbi:MAG: RdgB/HAM1 family non-canonical purine NTP pyrophosphatase [Bacteroidales bacterium]|jgi:XTP/dITP diphosphohydrolase|nr:RdgB/HAM1 family non-canonical purine NTP pyrophosphatase [Bacteroidales bacterium]
MERQSLIFATGNKGKLKEAGEILGEKFEVIGAAAAGFTEEVEETGQSFQDNALLKSQALYDALGKDCFSDDSGLEVDALDGAPGIYSARYAGEDKDFECNIDKVLSQMEGKTDRRARFRCCVSLIWKGERYFFDGKLEGEIGYARKGHNGFGYDPIFIPDWVAPGVANTERLTLAEISAEDKNRISHRAEALFLLSEFLNA